MLTIHLNSFSVAICLCVIFMSYVATFLCIINKRKLINSRKRKTVITECNIAHADMYCCASVCASLVVSTVFLMLLVVLK